jgi:hypothetical protein
MGFLYIGPAYSIRLFEQKQFSPEWAFQATILSRATDSAPNRTAMPGQHAMMASYSGNGAVLRN